MQFKSSKVWAIYCIEGCEVEGCEAFLSEKFNIRLKSLISVNTNRPGSIYQYANMSPRLSGQTFIFGVVFFVCKSLLGSN